MVIPALLATLKFIVCLLFCFQIDLLLLIGIFKKNYDSITPLLHFPAEAILSVSA